MRKRRREIGADDLLRLPIEEMKTCQHERLATENTADKDARLQQISELQHKPKGYQLRVPLKGDIRLQHPSQDAIQVWLH